MAEAGCDLFRINFSHGEKQQWSQLFQGVRSVEALLGRPLGLLADLCGPKIRIAALSADPLNLASGDELFLFQNAPVDFEGSWLTTNRDRLFKEMKRGEPLLFDDGKIEAQIESLDEEKLSCQVLRGGTLSLGKGINLPKTQLQLSALTEKDRQDALWAQSMGFDFLALSFIQRVSDLLELRTLLSEEGPQIIAKIEKLQAVEQIDSIIQEADAVMIARGDLGVEMRLSLVPVAQKRIARLCQEAGRPCIVATQMFESMIQAPTPTRAEVSDVANAVMDQADAVMLSGETSVGAFPVEAVQLMDEVVAAIQTYHDEISAPHAVCSPDDPLTAALSRAIHEIIEREKIAAIAIFSVSGETARILSKNRLKRPILALSRDLRVVRRMSLYYGVEPRRVEVLPRHTREVLKLAADLVLEMGLAKRGERLIVLSGRPIEKRGAINTLVVHQIP